MIVLEQLVPARVDEVYALFTDPQSIPRLHPLVKRVVVTERSERRVAFELFEAVPLGPLRVPNRYQGEYVLEPEGPHTLRARGVSFPRVTVDASFRFEAKDEGTRVVEQLVVSAPLGLGGFVTRTAEAAHRGQLAALARHFASR